MIGTELLNLKFVSKGSRGWESEELLFGRTMTFLHGENGSGKTPLLLGIVYCLGYPSEFRSDIVSNCLSVELKIKIGMNSFLIARTFDKRSWSAKNLATDELTTFSSEKEFCEWYFDLASIPRVELTNSDEKKSASVYMSTFLPAFYVDQNHGWQDFYWPPTKFIKDQYQEMARLLFTVSPKNPHKKKEALIQEKMNLARIQEVIEDREFVLKELEKTIGDDTTEKLQELHDKRDKVKSRLKQLQENATFQSKKTTTFDTRISDLQLETSKISDERNELRLRVSAFDSIKAEIASEVEALSLNVEAAASFRRLCNSVSEGCKLFRISDEAYGKSLLYLKDQMKDLEANKERMQKSVENAEIKISKINNEILEERKKLETFIKSDNNEGLVNELKNVSQMLVDIETRIAFRSKLEDQKGKYGALLAKRSESQKRVQELQISSRNSGDSLLLEIRNNLAVALEKWLGILNTPNVQGPYRFDERLALTIGNDKLKVFRGSTLTRIVLAYHASVIEVALGMGGANHLGFCILDTPMQQELKVSDLQGYITALRELLVKSQNKIQICLSFSDSNIVPDREDTIWEPKFQTSSNGKKYYLKVSGE